MFVTYLVSVLILWKIILSTTPFSSVTGPTTHKLSETSLTATTKSFPVPHNFTYLAASREKCTRFWWESPKERDHLEDQDVGGKMGSEWILGRLACGVWIGFDWLRTGTGGGLWGKPEGKRPLG
jgi:hypothetical protein